MAKKMKQFTTSIFTGIFVLCTAFVAALKAVETVPDGKEGANGTCKPNGSKCANERGGCKRWFTNEEGVVTSECGVCESIKIPNSKPALYSGCACRTIQQGKLSSAKDVGTAQAFCETYGKPSKPSTSGTSSQE